MKRLSLVLMLIVGASGSFADLKDCHGISGAQERLACYDRTTGYQAQEPAVSRGKASEESLVRDTPTVSYTPDAESFGMMPERSAATESLSAILTRVDRDNYGKLTLYLENDQVWRQVDASRLPLSRGDNVVITEAALGSFLLEKASGSRTIRVRRIR